MVSRAVTILLAAVAATTGCAARQTIPLDCLSEEVRVYVDGRLLEEHGGALELSAEEPHKLYFKQEGREPQLIVLETRIDAGGRPKLSPADVCVKLIPIGLGRELTIEGDEGAADEN